MDSSLIRTLSSVPLVSVLRSLTVVTCIHAWQTNPCKNEFVSMKCPHTSHVSRWSVSQFSKCMSLFRHGCSLPATQLTWLPVSHSFWNSQTLLKYPDQMNWQFVLMMASKPPSQPSSPPIYYMNLSLTQSAELFDLIGNPISACLLISWNNILQIEPFLKQGAQKSDLL